MLNSFLPRHTIRASLSRIPVFCLLILLAITGTTKGCFSETAPNSSSPRQFAVIVFDDMRFDDLRYLPSLSSLTQRRGQALNNAFITCPLCCPSRASLLTGLLSSKHGVTANPTKLRVPTIFPALHAARIRTGLVGKYLNSHEGRPLPEFDYWASFRRGNIRDWLNPRMNINGRFRTLNSYISDIVLEHADIFTTRYASDPYVLYMNFSAPHRPATTPPEFPRSCEGIELPSEFGKVDPTAPQKYQVIPRLNKAKVLQYACDRATSLAYLDQKVTSFVEGLTDKGVTVIIVSDNGVMLGEYGLREKAYPYPQVVRSPFLIFNHARIDPNRVISLVDIPATILKSFGVSSPNNPIDGIPLDEPRTTATIEHVGSTRRLPFTAIATPGMIRVTYRGGFEQNIPY
jgi:N-acetylglucosamine-6-sulfatase